MELVIAVLLGVLLGFVIRGSFMLGELREGQKGIGVRLDRIEERLDRINDELKEMRKGS